MNAPPRPVSLISDLELGEINGEPTRIATVTTVRSADEWASVIRADLGRAVENLIAAGKNLIAAKADVGHGEYLSEVLPKAGISKSDAYRLEGVAKNFENFPNLGSLPTSPTALEALGKAAPERIEAGIKSGYIKPSMTIKQAKEFVKPKPVPKPEPESHPCVECGSEMGEQWVEGNNGGRVCEDCADGGPPPPKNPPAMDDARQVMLRYFRDVLDPAIDAGSNIPKQSGKGYHQFNDIEKTFMVDQIDLAISALNDIRKEYDGTND